jgi:rubrerythrin
MKCHICEVSMFHRRQAPDLEFAGKNINGRNVYRCPTCNTTVEGANHGQVREVQSDRPVHQEQGRG